jgi:hypothetical protein
MIKNFKIFENSNNNLKVLGNNESYWSWEYDSTSVLAEVLLNESNGSLILKITKTHSKTGIGAGNRTEQVAFESIGNINKPDLVKARSLLKKHALSRSSASKGFSIHWKDEEGNKMTLSELIKLNKPEKELKHIKNISNFKEESTNIEIVKYSDKSYALFGEDTKNIKDKLIELGCRYNRFLTDPTTGEKRPGWICSTRNIDNVKDILK